MMFAMLLALGAAAQPAPSPPTEAQALIANCNAHKFETTVKATVDGKPRKSQVKLCGKEGQSDADWIKTLKDAVGKVEANAQMPAEVRSQITTALDLEIAKLEADIRQKEAIAAPLRPRETFALPDAGALRNQAPSPLPEYAVLPPLPAPKPVAAPGAAGGIAAVAIPRLAEPKLTLRCRNPADLAGDVPCIAFERETLLTVRADENLPAGTALRFVRNGDARAEVALSQARRGRSMVFKLPIDVCAGGGGGKLTVEVVRTAPSVPAGQVVGSRGPYLLNC